MSDRVQIFDTTLRDGEQAPGCQLNTPEKIAMIIKTRPELGLTTNLDTTKLMPTSHLVSRLMHMPVQANKAIVGANAFAHSSGIHQNGLLKNRLTYEIMRPEDIGAEAATLNLTARSGRSALKHHLDRLGHQTTPAQLDTAYQQFLAIANRQKHISDQDLHQLIAAST